MPLKLAGGMGGGTSTLARMVECCGSTLPTLIISLCPSILPSVKLAASRGGSPVLAVVVGTIVVVELPGSSGAPRNVTE